VELQLHPALSHPTTTFFLLLMSQLYAYDIETGALPDEILLPVMPKFYAPKNYTKEDKIADAIDAKQRAWFRDAALRPETGMIYAIGIKSDKTETIISHGETTKTLADERKDLEAFFMFVETHHTDATFVGFNSNDFDIPFIVMRAVYHKLKIPPSFFTGGNYGGAGKQFRDLHQVTEFGSFDRRKNKRSLRNTSVAFGYGDKSDVGKFFADTWKENRVEADEYLKQDLKITLDIANRLRESGLL